MIVLGEGYEVHFAEKLGLSDEDMEFTLPVEPLIKAGLDVNKLDGTGWKFEKASADNSGMSENQLVRPFKLK